MYLCVSGFVFVYAWGQSALQYVLSQHSCGGQRAASRYQFSPYCEAFKGTP